MVPGLLLLGLLFFGPPFLGLLLPGLLLPVCCCQVCSPGFGPPNLNGTDGGDLGRGHEFDRMERLDSNRSRRRELFREGKLDLLSDTIVSYL
jgi:hypothetical protein